MSSASTAAVSSANASTSSSVVIDEREAKALLDDLKLQTPLDSSGIVVVCKVSDGAPFAANERHSQVMRQHNVVIAHHSSNLMHDDDDSGEVYVVSQLSIGKKWCHD